MTELSEIWGMSQRVIVNSVRDFVGCSGLKRVNELAELIARGVDDPKQFAHDLALTKDELGTPRVSNCALFALGIMHRVGVPHPLLSGKYQQGMAMSWVLTIGRERCALHVPGKDEPCPPAGAILHYGTPGKFNDHIEFCLGDPDEQGLVDHGGGGRLHNAIDESHGVWRKNSGRPLLHWIDPVKLLEGVP